MPEHEQMDLIPREQPADDPQLQAEREAARKRLAELLKDPEFRAIEGFPIGEDEDILELSDPPFYTACPNPFIPEIIEKWQQERKEIRNELRLVGGEYQREPFAADVSEGKNHPIYNAHSYHTKVPHKAIMRYILHFTDPGDIVFDGFCGTGMTGVAAQLCGDKRAVEELAYRVDDNGTVWEGNKAISRLGARKAVLNDLSPAATFIAYNYNSSVDKATFECEAKRILREVEQECGWMYETWHPNCEAPNRVKGRINYTVWSDIFICPTCGAEMVFWNVAVDQDRGGIRNTWYCPDCAALLAKSPKKDSGALRIERAWVMHYDRELKQTIRSAKQVPVLINYSVGKKRYEKRTDSSDLDLIQKIDESKIPHPFPTNQIPKGDKTSDPFNLGVNHVHQFYTPRNLSIHAFIHNKILTSVLSPKYKNSLLFLMSSYNMSHSTKMTRMIFKTGGKKPLLTGNQSGTLYISSLPLEKNVIKGLAEKLDIIKKAFNSIHSPYSFITTQSGSLLQNIFSDCIDYIFVDPPFGSNLMYSELNFIWESWLRVISNNTLEAIINNTQHKALPEYQQIMQACFNEFYRILKAGRWMTVEFHNSQNSVWNSIQEALQRARFIVADVRVLDKGQGSFNQATASGAVKQDLIISVYKPNDHLEERFKLIAGTKEGAWEFVRYHLGKLPVINQTNNSTVINAERQTFLLFDRMVAFHIQRDVMVPISAPEFYAGLEQRFIHRDGMYFLPDQVTEYDRALLDFGKPTQIPLFVTGEKTAIIWLRQQLDPAFGGEPKTRGDLTNAFNQIMHRAKHEKALELIEILDQNYLQDETGKWYVPDHNKASDLEKVRQRSLLREFKEYMDGRGRLRQFRTEAVRAGFLDALRKQDYDTIIKVAERLPENVLREDPDLLMYYDSAMLRKK